MKTNPNKQELRAIFSQQLLPGFTTEILKTFIKIVKQIIRLLKIQLDLVFRF